MVLKLHHLTRGVGCNGLKEAGMCKRFLGDVIFDFLVEEGGGQILPSIFWSGGGNYAGPSCSKVG